MIQTRPRATPLIGFGVFFAALSLMTRCSSSNSAARFDQEAGVSSAEACGQDGDCSLPPSNCNAEGSAIVYFTDPKCAEGRCQWQRQTMACPCAGGGCRFSTTTGSAMMPGPADGAAGGAAEASDDGAPDHAMISIPDGGSCAASDAGVCGLPPSVCADNRWLAYFTNATCVEGGCRWDVAYRDCGAIGCVNHGCNLNITAPAAP